MIIFVALLDFSSKPLRGACSEVSELVGVFDSLDAARAACEKCSASKTDSPHFAVVESRTLNADNGVGDVWVRDAGVWTKA